MSFLHLRPAELRAPETIVLPDDRKRLTRFFGVAQIGVLPPELNIPWGTADTGEAPTGWTGLRLVGRRMDDELAPKGNDTRQVIALIYEQIHATDETRVGRDNITHGEDGGFEVVQEWVQFTTGTYVPGTVSSSTVTVLAQTAYLKSVEAPDDGTVRRIKRTYTTAGTIATSLETKNGGALLIQSITSVKTVPSTPSGYTLIGQPVQHPGGLPIYTYTYAKGDGEISREIDYSQSVDQGTNGLTRVTIRHLTAASINTDPTTDPGSMVKISEGKTDQDGYRVWTIVWAKGAGTVETRDEARADGSFVYYRTTLASTASTPTTPSGSSLVDLAQAQSGGHFVNRAIFVKPPPTIAYRQTMKVPMPGLAYFSGTDLILQPPTVRTLLVTVTISFATSQDTTAPFSITSYGSFTETYVPTASGQPVNKQIGLNGYLCSGVTISGSGTYKGVAVDSYSAQRFASTPTALPTGTTTLSVENEPYLTDLSGTMIFKRTVVTAPL